MRSIATMTRRKLDLLYFFGKDRILSYVKKAPVVLSNEETIDRIANSRCSISRFGDGEFHLMVQTRDLKFQERSDELSRRLKEIIASNVRGHLVGIPKVFSEKDLAVRTSESRRFWRDHVANYRLQWYRHLDFGKIYCSSTFTRNYIAVEDKSNLGGYFNKVRSIWDGEDVLIVEGRFSRIGAGNDLFSNAKSISRILCPPENAFRRYDDILREAARHASGKLVIIALGPTATVLAYDLHQLGHWAVDIGHLDVEFEWFLQRTTKRTKVNNKYVIEASSRIEHDDSFDDETYRSQIIGVIP